MIIETFEQGSPAWFAARAGIPTASNFAKIITSKGEPSKQAKAYLYQLAGEAILGIPEETYTNGHMERGKEIEAEARTLYEFITGNTVRQVGMVYQDERKAASCSPDGMIDGSEIGLEIKCPKLSTHVEYLIKGKLPTDYFQQVHGSMFITGYREWDFMSYYPGLPPLIITVQRDDMFNGVLSVALGKFCRELEEVKQAIQQHKVK